MNPSGSNLQDHHTAMTEFASSSSPQPSSNMPHFDSSFQPPISMPLMPHYYYPHSDYPNFMNTTFSQPSPSPAPLPPIPCYYYYGSQSQSQSQIVVPQTQVIDLELKNEIVKQIEYYFSNENLIKDSYLRSKMNHKGWVHIDVIAEFRRVKRFGKFNSWDFKKKKNKHMEL
ncbi:la-related protein 1C-like [Senna tora]|uniref:La-related protein 1C-like n=1 Tax=Senna tora TaxID=362788 RepID=A0A834SEZ3_9FABA|nr:la-related protein 1C-like [Senna tora]